MRIKLYLLCLVSLMVLAGCNSRNAEEPSPKVVVAILYPNGEGKTFDMNYYAENHMPMVAELMGDAMGGYSIDKGIAGRTPEDQLPYLAIGYLYFDSLEAYQNAFGPHAEQIVGDIPNYTNIQPVIQISEVVK